MGPYKDFIEKKNYWLNQENWINKSSDNQYILLKRTLLDTIIKCKNVGDLSFSLLQDIDLVSCLLNTHTIKNTILAHKISHCQLLRDSNLALHILKLGIIDENICQKLLLKFKFFKNDSDLAKKILLERNNYFYFSYFKKLLKEESFVFSLFENNKFNNPFCLISLPQHKEISQFLIERNSYPSQQTCDLKIQFNDTVLHDIKFINKILRKPQGHSLYKFLSQEMRHNTQICMTMLKYHPEYDIENSKLKTLKNFKTCSKFWIYYNDFISQIEFFGSVFDNDENLFEAFKCLSPIRRMSKFNSLSFHYHSMVHFIVNKSTKSHLLKTFLASEKGKHLLSLPVNSSPQIREIDNWIYDELVIVLEKLKLYNKLSGFKDLAKEKIMKI